MEYTTLGKTGLRVSRMGFSGIPIQKVDAAVTRKLMERLVERGVNYIDTARGYTVSESFLGEALEGLVLREAGASRSHSSRVFPLAIVSDSSDSHAFASVSPTAAITPANSPAS